MTASKDLLGIELLVQCSSCGATVPITRPVQRNKCSHCLDQAEEDEQAWRAKLEGHLSCGPFQQGFMRCRCVYASLPQGKT